MVFKTKKHFKTIYIILDLLIYWISFLLAYYLRYKTLNLTINAYTNEHLLLSSLWSLGLIIFLNNHKLYMTDRMLSVYREVSRVARSVIYSAFVLIVFMYVFKIQVLSRTVFLYSIFFLIIFISLWRVVKRLAFRHMVKNGYKNVNLLIIGAGSAAESVADEISNLPYLGLKLKGYLDDYKTGEYLGKPIFGTLADFEKIVRREFIDEIIITIPSQQEKVKAILDEAKKLRKSVKVLAENYGYAVSKVDFYNLGVLPLLSYHEVPQHGAHSSFKRFFDILISFIALIFMFPFFVLIAVIVKLDSKGPVFYVSKRAGLKGRIFDFIKFRTMYTGADAQKAELQHKNEVAGGKIFKIKEDPRITKVGKFLRKYSIDELPQVLNVLKGDMSIVGPRPFPVEEFKEFDYFHMARADIKPGITGLAQIRGRSDLSFYRWVKWDIWYVNNWSFWLDFVILIRTVPVVLKGKGAY